MDIHLKRVYDPAGPEDGYRVLVDRLWPRGVWKEDLPLDEWAKDITPSTEARKEFAHKAENFEAFRARYLMELDANPAAPAFARRLQDAGTATLLYAARDVRVNHAVVLAEWLAGRLQDGPQAGAGDAS